GAAEPDKQSANFMFQYCRGFISDQAQMPPPATALWRGTCVGSVQGLSLVSNLLPADINSCIPDKVTLEQKVRVVLAYIERRPQRMHEDFHSLALEAMREAWPCK